MFNLVHFFLGFFLFFPGVASAQEATVLLKPDFLSPELEIVSDNPFSLSQQEGGFLLKVSSGVTYAVHPLQEPFDELKLALGSDQKVNLTVVANISSGGNYTYELQQTILPGDKIKEYRISLRHAFFKNASDFGIKIETPKPANLVIREVVLNKYNLTRKVVQVFKDYFRAAPYTTSTVNVFPAPRIFGRSAFVYLLPLLLILLILLAVPKYRKGALVGLLILWLFTDLRMNYEFFRYAAADNRTWIKPPAAEKTLRNYGDFYAFAAWVKKTLPPGTRAVNLYLDNDHFYGILKYRLYPVMTERQGKIDGPYVIHNRPDVQLGPGEVMSRYDEDSFIFIPSLSPP